MELHHNIIYIFREFANTSGAFTFWGEIVLSLSQAKFSGYGESMFRAHEADVVGMSLFHRVVQSGTKTPLYSILQWTSKNPL